MNKRRLLKLAGLLEADAKNEQGVQFDLSRWAAPSDYCVFKTKPGSVPVDCSTSACAMGLACISGAFSREGLTFGFTINKFWDGYELVPRFEGSRGVAAAKKLFSITRGQAEFLFLPSCYPYEKRKGAIGERYVAQRIRDFVAGKVAP